MKALRSDFFLFLDFTTRWPPQSLGRWSRMTVAAFPIHSFLQHSHQATNHGICSLPFLFPFIFESRIPSSSLIVCLNIKSKTYPMNLGNSQRESILSLTYTLRANHKRKDEKKPYLPTSVLHKDSLVSVIE